MTTGRINQVTIPQRTRTLCCEMLREPYCVCLLSKDARIRLTICKGIRSATEDTDSVQPSDGNPFYLCHVFPPIHPSKLQTYQSDCKSRECQKDTSGKNVSSESQPLFLAKGHHVQQPSVLSLSRPRQLGYMFSHFMPPTEQVWSTLLLFPRNAIISYPRTHYRAGLTHPDRMQLNCSFGLSRCLPSH